MNQKIKIQLRSAGIFTRETHSVLGKLKTPSGSDDGRFCSTEQCVQTLSRLINGEINPEFARRLFSIRINDKTCLYLPPIARQDPQLCKALSRMVCLTDVPKGRSAEVRNFLAKVFTSAATRRLSSYELLLMEFAVDNKNYLEIHFQPFAAEERVDAKLLFSEIGQERIAFGMINSINGRPNTPQEAFGVLIHELCHARERILNYGSAGQVTEELRAFIYQYRGNLKEAFNQLKRNCQQAWEELTSIAPGLTSLSLAEQYVYADILASTDRKGPAAFLAASKELAEVFPQLDDKITTLACKHTRTL